MSEPARTTTIEPVRFRPTAVDDTRRRLPLTRGRIAAIAAVLAVAWFLWFLFTAKSVRFDIEPATAAVEVSGGFELEFAGIRLLRQGAYLLRATAPGYHPLEAVLDVAARRAARPSRMS